MSSNLNSTKFKINKHFQEIENLENEIKEHKRRIEIMNAFIDGAKIQYVPLSNDYNNFGWASIDNPAWNWDTHDYRIKTQKVLIELTFSNDVVICVNPEYVDTCVENMKHLGLDVVSKTKYVEDII